jgi:hypothetical protein
MVWRAAAGPAVIKAYRDFMKSAMEEVGGSMAYITGPDAPFAPEARCRARNCRAGSGRSDDWIWFEDEHVSVLPVSS